MNAAIFLDRDNTIIHNDGDLGDPEQVRLIQGAASAIASMCGLGYKIIVVSNQDGVAHGVYKEEDVHAVNQRIAELVDRAANGARIDRFYDCPYHPEGKVKKYAKEHPDRKPQPGMILRAAEQMQLDLSQSWTIGDQRGDVEAGAAAGTRTILLEREASALAPLDVTHVLEALMEEKDSEHHRRIPTFKAPTLIEAVRIIAQQRKPEVGEHINRPLKGARRLDRETMAKLQQPRPQTEADQPQPDVSSGAGPRREAERPFRPWNAPYFESEVADALSEGRISLEKAEELTAGRVSSRVGPERQPPQPRQDDAPQAEEETAATSDASAAPPTPAPNESPTQTPTPAAMPPSATRPATATPTDIPSAQGESDMPVQPPASDLVEAGGQSRTEAGPAASAPSPSATQVASESSEQAAHSAPTPATDQPDAEAAKLLKAILTEIRQQRGSGEEFSLVTILAIILQLIAIVCLLGGLWMGQEDATLFLRWAVAALMAQLATIAMLLFARNP